MTTTPTVETINSRLRWLGHEQPNTYDMLDDGHFARFGLPRTWNGQVFNGGTFAGADVSTYRVEEAVAALPLLNQYVMLNWERCSGWKEGGVVWVKRTIAALKARRPDCLVGMYDFRDQGACDDVVDLWWPSATVDAPMHPMGRFEKDAVLHWLNMRHATYHAALRRAEIGNREVIPVLHVNNANGDQLATSLNLLAAMPRRLTKLATWANVGKNDHNGYLQATAKMDAVEARWRALVAARGAL